jgi:hypothetical protein
VTVFKAVLEIPGPWIPEWAFPCSESLAKQGFSRFKTVTHCNEKVPSKGRQREGLIRADPV